METLQPDGWPRPKGYANGVAARGRTLWVAGQIGWDPVTGQVVSDNFAAQVRQALVNLTAVLRTGGAEPHHLVRLTWYITDRSAYLGAQREIGQMYREVLGKNFPAMSVVVVDGLIEKRAKVEIEATAVIPD
ncbi:MAG: RidA family protein [Gemmatimonadota bacterium]|nr:RidA family protein [Gemmatimonadota bacterium]